MRTDEIYQKVTELHDHVIGLLRATKTPPFPAHYKKYFDQLFLESADDAMKKEQENAEHKIQSESKEDVTRYIDLAKRSVMAFVESHSDIASVAQAQKEYVEQAPVEMLEHFFAFVEGLNTINETMGEELDKAQSKITDLSTQLHEALATMTVDPLTKVGNRSAFMERMEPILEVGQERKLAMVLMMIDVDNFKYLNDEHGAVAGDKVLYFLAQTIKSMIREGDRVYRYGGDELAVVMSRCDGKQAFIVADKIRAKIEQSKLLYNGTSIHLTISIGVTVHQEADTYDTITSRAKEALYCAKKSDKNCTFLHDW